MDLATFRERYPEFTETPDVQVQDMLDDAAGTLPTPYASPWGTYYDQAHGLLTAHRLAISPSGQMARLTPDASGSTTYAATFAALRREVTCGLRIF